MNGKDMKDRREREQSRYRRGMGSQTQQEANAKMASLYGSTYLNLPKDVSQFELKSKAPLLDFLLYEVGKGNPFADPGAFHYERTFWVHKGIGPDNRAYCCPREMSRGRLPCPICEKRQELKDDPNADEKLIEALKPKRRQLFKVIDLNNRDKGVQVWDFSYHMFGELLVEYLTDENNTTKLKNWCEFEGGKSLRLGTKEKKYNGKPYYEVTRIEFEDRRKDYDPAEMLEKGPCLDECFRVLPYDELKKVFMQTGEETEGTKHKFKESDVEKIRDMNGKELAKFIIVNDIDIDTDDYPETEDLQAAVIEKIEEAIAGDEPKSGKKSGKKAKDEEPEEPEDTPAEIEEGSEVTWDDDGDEKTGTVKSIKGKKAVVEDEDGDEHKVALDDLTLADGGEKEEEEEEKAEIEVGSDVKWTDDDQDEHEGTVKKIKKGVATVKEGKKEYEVEVGDLELTD
jgi:plastocyanin